MKTFQILVITAILFIFSISAFVQDTVLAQVNPPLTQSIVNRLINLYEFSLDGRFTAESRKRIFATNCRSMEVK